MATLSDLKARFFAAVTGKRNRTDAEMAYYQLAADGAIPLVDPETLTDGDTLVWDAGTSSWVAGAGAGGGAFTILESGEEIPVGASPDSVFFRKE